MDTATACPCNLTFCFLNLAIHKTGPKRKICEQFLLKMLSERGKRCYLRESSNDDDATDRKKMLSLFEVNCETLQNIQIEVLMRTKDVPK